MDKDRLVSLGEFLIATKKKEFLEPDSWEVREMLLRCRVVRIPLFSSSNEA